MYLSDQGFQALIHKLVIVGRYTTTMRIEDVSDDEIKNAGVIGYISPPRIFENQHHIVGIATDYKFPGGRTAQEMERLIRSHAYFNATHAEGLAGLSGQWHFFKYNQQKLLDSGMTQDDIEIIRKVLESAKSFGNVAEDIAHIDAINSLWNDPENPYYITEVPGKKEIARLEKQFLQDANEWWTEIVRLNPLSLRQLTPKRTDVTDMFDVLLGVTSGFNQDDIAFHLSGKERSATTQKLFENYFSGEYSPGWNMSDPTLLRVLTQIHPDIIQDTDYQKAQKEVSARKR